MIAAETLQSIREGLSQQLPRTVIVEGKVPVINTNLDYMRSIEDEPSSGLTVDVEVSKNAKLIGILFAHPATKMTQREILGHLQHFHIRSGTAVDFFCAGYGAYWSPEYLPDKKPVAKIENIEWFFSDVAYSNIIDQLHEKTNQTWKDTGHVELVLISAFKNEDDVVVLDFSSAVVCDLEEMEKDGAFKSVRAFFTDIFRYANDYNEQDPSWDFSDNRGAVIARGALKDAVLSLLPESLRRNYRQAEHYAVRNLT